MGRLEAFEATQVTCHVAIHKNIFGEEYDWGRKILKMLEKQPKLKVIIHAFGLSRSPSSRCRGMPPREIGGHWKAITWVGTNI